ncbi:MAG TPA: molybdate ABC transporter substrate-binding protein [Gemmataceae bacterium]|jgi:molybdenum ABC transporter molybdate-binding protein
MSTNRPSRNTRPTAPVSAGDLPSWGEDWRIGLRVWVERGGQSILGPGRLELLEGIDRHHSISAAARQLGISYRRAWELVQSINQAAGEPFVLAATGGVHGGGASLTPLGRWAVAVFRDMQEQLGQRAAGLFPLLARQTSGSVLHLAAAVSLEEVVGQLLNDFALQAPGVRVRAVYGASDELADHLLAGAPGDIFLTADARQLDRLRAANLLHRERHVSLAENGLAAIGLAAGHLAVRRPADLAREDCRVALADPNCPLGAYTRTYLEGLNLYGSLRPRTVWVENSRAAVAAVRAGQAEAAVVYSSDAFRAEGCRSLFRARRLPVPILYRGTVLHRGQEPAAARQLLAFLSSPQSASRYRRCGFRAVHDRG